MIADFFSNEVSKDWAEVDEHLESWVKTIASPQTDIPPGFRTEYWEEAVTTAVSLKKDVALSTKKILEIAAKINEQKFGVNRLNRKEFPVWLKESLGWAASDAKKFLSIARVFGEFEQTQLYGLDPFTLLKLTQKRYAPVVERLREEAFITQSRVQEMISQLLPKKTRHKKGLGDYKEAVLQKHASAADGSFYYTLGKVNLSERVGSALEAELETRTIGQILAEALQTNDGVATARAQVPVAEFERVEAENEKLRAELQERERQIALLEAQLADRKSVSVSSNSPSSPSQEEEVAQTTEVAFSDFSSWEEAALVMKCDPCQLLATVRTWSASERRHLSKLLADFLEEETASLDAVAWVPPKLLDAALKYLSFSVRKISGANNLVDEPTLENIRGCRFVSLHGFGTKYECWVFQAPDERQLVVFGRDWFKIECF